MSPDFGEITREQELEWDLRDVKHDLEHVMVERDRAIAEVEWLRVLLAEVERLRAQRDEVLALTDRLIDTQTATQIAWAIQAIYAEEAW